MRFCLYARVVPSEWLNGFRGVLLKRPSLIYGQKSDFFQPPAEKNFTPQLFYGHFFCFWQVCVLNVFKKIQNILLLYNGQFISKSGSIHNKLFISLLSYGQFFDFWQVYILIIFKISKNNSHLYGLGETKWKPQI